MSHCCTGPILCIDSTGKLALNSFDHVFHPSYFVLGIPSKLCSSSLPVQWNLKLSVNSVRAWLKVVTHCHFHHVHNLHSVVLYRPHSHTHSLTYSLTHTHTHSLTYSHTHLLARSHTHSHTLTHILTHSFTHSPIHTPTHSHTHSLTDCTIECNLSTKLLIHVLM